MKLTAKESLLLACIAESEYHGVSLNDPAFVSDQVWSDCVGDEFVRRGGNRPGAGGIMASLSKKGLVVAYFNGEYHVCSLTSAGVEAYKHGKA